MHDLAYGSWQPPLVQNEKKRKKDESPLSFAWCVRGGLGNLLYAASRDFSKWRIEGRRIVFDLWMKQVPREKVMTAANFEKKSGATCDEIWTQEPQTLPKLCLARGMQLAVALATLSGKGEREKVVVKEVFHLGGHQGPRAASIKQHVRARVALTPGDDRLLPHLQAHQPGFWRRPPYITLLLSDLVRALQGVTVSACYLWLFFFRVAGVMLKSNLECQGLFFSLNDKVWIIASYCAPYKNTRNPSFGGKQGKRPKPWRDCDVWLVSLVKSTTRVGL